MILMLECAANRLLNFSAFQLGKKQFERCDHDYRTLKGDEEEANS